MLCTIRFTVNTRCSGNQPLPRPVTITGNHYRYLPAIRAYRTPKTIRVFFRIRQLRFTATFHLVRYGFPDVIPGPLVLREVVQRVEQERVFFDQFRRASGRRSSRTRPRFSAAFHGKPIARRRNRNDHNDTPYGDARVQRCAKMTFK